MAKDPEERFESCARARRRRRGRRSASTPPPPQRAGAVAAARRPSPRSRWPRRAAGGRPAPAATAPRGAAPTGCAGPRRPAHERGRRPHRRSPAIPGKLARDARRGLDGRLPRAACSGATSPARARPSGSPPTASRATSPRSATRSTSRADGRSFSGVVSRYDAVDRRARGHDRPARLRDGLGRGRRLGRRLPVRAAAEHRRAAAAQAAPSAFLPFRSPATVENSRVQFRELAVGAGSLWVLGDALDRRLWRLDARTGAARGDDRARLPADLGRRRGRRGLDHRRPGRPGRPGRRRGRTGLLAPVRGRPRGERHRRRRRAPSGSRTRSTAPSRGSTRARGGWSRRSTVGGLPRGVAVGRRVGLGDRACALSVGAGLAAAAALAVVALAAARGRLRRRRAQPLRIGVIVDCVGINRSLHDAELSGRRAAADRARGASCAGDARGGRRHRGRGRAAGRSSSCRGCTELWEFSTLTAEVAAAGRARARRRDRRRRQRRRRDRAARRRAALSATSSSSPSPTARAR